MSRLTWAAVAITSTMAHPARKMMPLENTNRWPRLVSWRGMKLSPAWNDASRGKAAKRAESRGAYHQPATADAELLHPRVVDGMGEATAEVPDRAHDEKDEHVEDEEVGGDGEDLPRLLHAAEVAVGDQHDEADRDRHHPR